MPVLRATYWKSNAEMIEAIVELGFLDRDMKVLDPTYGKGIWWKKFKPRKLVKHDLILDGTDFRNLPHRSNTFDAAAYDPPYVSVGGRDTTGIVAMFDAYGMTGAPTSPRKLQRLINDGLKEMNRLVKPAVRTEHGLKGGIIIVKCMSYVSSGKIFDGVYQTKKAARKLGLVLEDELFHIRKSGGPQPGNRTKKLKTGQVVASRQHHSRGNVSVALIFRKKKVKAKKK